MYLWEVCAVAGLVFVCYISSGFVSRHVVAWNYGIGIADVTKGSWPDTVARKLIIRTGRVALHFVIYMFLQSCFNMAYFYYARHGYIGSFQSDVLYRNSECYYRHSFDSVQGAISFLSFV